MDSSQGHALDTTIGESRYSRKARRVSEAMLKMVKLDIAGLKAAHEAR